MGRWIWIGGAVCVALVLYAVWLWQRIETVQPHQQAVVERGDTLEVLGPGVHIVGGLIRDVTLYDVFLERQHRVADPVMVDGCAVSLILTYNVSDVVTFHEAGGDVHALAGRDAELLALAEAAGLTLEGLRGPEMNALREAIGGALPPGLGLLRLHADVADCEGAAPRGELPAPVEVERVPVDLVQAETPLGALRAEIDSVQLVSADGMRLELRGAAATYDVFDTVQAEACFGTSRDERLADIVWSVSQMGLRQAAGNTDVPDLPRALAEMVPSRAAQLEADCGLRVGPIDFGAARLEWIRAAR